MDKVIEMSLYDNLFQEVDDEHADLYCEKEEKYLRFKEHAIFDERKFCKVFDDEIKKDYKISKSFLKRIQKCTLVIHITRDMPDLSDKELKVIFVSQQRLKDMPWFSYIVAVRSCIQLALNYRTGFVLTKASLFRHVAFEVSAMGDDRFKVEIYFDNEALERRNTIYRD